MVRADYRPGWHAVKLRPHQEKAIELLKKSFYSGHKRPILAAPCAFGKTHLAAYLMKACQDKGKKALFICDRVKLIDQTIEVFQEWDIYFGVIQSDNPLTDYAAPVQIASAQSLTRRIETGYKIEADLIIIDECHVTYDKIKEIFEKLPPKIMVIGLSATPYSKGLGLIYDDLLVPITTEELLELGFLTPIEYYAGAKVNVKGLKGRALSTGGTDFDPKLLASAVDDQKVELTGDIVKNWMKHGQNLQTIAFSPSIAQSKYMVDLFMQKGIAAAHIDGYTEYPERIRMFKEHDEGKIKILSCSQLLSVGYDSPTTSCMIDCFPTRSKILFQQRGGRIMRISKNKIKAIYLDHAGNISRHGLVEWMVPEKLSTNEKTFKEESQLREEKEKKAKDCPKCGKIVTGLRCSCGFEFKIEKKLDSSEEMLQRITGGKATPIDRQYMGKFYSSLLRIARNSGYSDGWAAHKYRAKFDRWPRSLEINLTGDFLPDAEEWVRAGKRAWAQNK